MECNFRVFQGIFPGVNKIQGFSGSSRVCWPPSITDSDVEDASPEEMVLDCDDDNSDEELDHDHVDI